MVWKNDSELFRYLMRLATSVFLGLGWFMACLAAGIFWELAHTSTGTKLIFVMLYYLCVIGTGFLLFRYLQKLWKKQG